MEGHVIQQQANVIVVQATQEKGAKMNVQLELLEYSVQRPANAGMVESAITLVVPVSVSQDTQENAVKRGYALKVFMVSNVIKSVPVTFQILTAVTLCLENAPANQAGLDFTAMRHVPQDSMVNLVNKSAVAKMVLTVIV